MKGSKNYFFAISGLAVLLGSFIMTVPRTSQPQARDLQPVTVENSPDRPVPVTVAQRVRVCPDADCPTVTLNANDRNAFHKQVQFEISGPEEEISIPVPEGKRLVIEFVAASQYLDLPKQPVGLRLRTRVNGEEAEYKLPQTKQVTAAGGTITLWTAAQPMRVYADTPDIHIRAGKTPTFGSSTVIVSVSGYLVDL